MTEPRIVSLDVQRLRASRGADSDPKYTWRLRVSTTTLSQEIEGEVLHFRPLIGFLRVDGPLGWGDIDVTALIRTNGDTGPEDAVEWVASADDMQTFYRFAKALLTPVLANVESDWSLPDVAPPVDVSQFELEFGDGLDVDGAESRTS